MKKIIFWIENYKNVLLYSAILLSFTLASYLFSPKFPAVIMKILLALEILAAIVVKCILEQKNSRLNDVNGGKEKERSGFLVCTIIFASFLGFMQGELNSREMKGELEKNRKADLTGRGQYDDSFLSGLATSKNMGCAMPPIKGDNKHFFGGYALYKAGGFYDGDVNYKYAIEEFNLAKDESKELGNSYKLWMDIGFCHNQLGGQEEAIQAFKKSLSMSECAGNYC